MSTHTFQPPRKEKSKTEFKTDVHVLEISDSATSRARGAGKNRRKTNPASITHCCQGFIASLTYLRLLMSRPWSLHATNCCKAWGTIFKSVLDATLGCLCASPPFTCDADAFLDSAPFPTKSQPMANFWPLMDAPALQEDASDKAMV